MMDRDKGLHRRMQLLQGPFKLVRLSDSFQFTRFRVSVHMISKCAQTRRVTSSSTSESPFLAGWLGHGGWRKGPGTVAGCSYVQVSSIIRLESCSGGGLTGRTCCCSFLSWRDPSAISRMFCSESVAVRVSGVTQACQPPEWPGPILRRRKKPRH